MFRTAASPFSPLSSSSQGLASPPDPSQIESEDAIERELIELLGAETFVDLEKLRDIARHGVPPSLRGEVWKYLLGVASPDKSEEITKAKRLKASYFRSDDGTSASGSGAGAGGASSTSAQSREQERNSAAAQQAQGTGATAVASSVSSSGASAATIRRQILSVRIRADINQFSTLNNAKLAQSGNVAAASTFVDPVVPQRGHHHHHHHHQQAQKKVYYLNKHKKEQFENVLLSFLHYNDVIVEYDPGLLHMLAPFIVSISEEYVAYYCFRTFMSRVMHTFQIGQRLQIELGKLMMLFRCTQPELYSYFEQEELEPNEWALPWIRYLLSKDLPIDCVCRLWDTYFATQDFDLHIYCCLALLQMNAEILMEYDYSEITYFLRHLPDMDMDKVIKQAQNIRAAVKASELLQ